MPAMKKNQTPIEFIKQICGLFKSIGVTQIAAEYDGSGDSGDFNYVQFRFDDPVARRDSDAPAGNAVLNEYLFKLQHVKSDAKPDALITMEMMDQLHNALFSILPGGWEIDDGSFGEIQIDTETKTVRMVHNERITDVNTSTQQW